VACIAEPHTKHCASHTNSVRCVHEQSCCKRPHQVLESHEHDQQFRENESIAIGKSQRLLKVGNGRINKVSAMRPGLARIIETVHISRYFESPVTDVNIAWNTCCIDYADTWWSKEFHGLSKTQSLHRCTSNYGWEDSFELHTGVAHAHLPIMGIHAQVAPKFKIQWLPATLYNRRWMDYCEVYHRSIQAIPILDYVDVEEAYCHIASRHQGLQWHVQSFWWCYVSSD